MYMFTFSAKVDHDSCNFSQEIICLHNLWTRHLLYPGRIRTRVSHGRPKIDIKIDVHMWFSVLCMFNIHKCIIHHINQNFSADAKMYHTCVYVDHT